MTGKLWLRTVFWISTMTDHYYIAGAQRYTAGPATPAFTIKKLIDIKSDGIYRSLHYIIKYKGYYVEIQGRTLFEEGWSEIDHDIVYPYYQDDEMLSSTFHALKPSGGYG